MATKIIDPGGTGDYTSLAAWEAARQSVLGDPEIAECICTNGAADPGGITIDGWTTTANNYIKIYVRPEYRHQGTYPSSGNYFRISQTSNANILRIIESYVKIDGLAIKYTYASARSAIENTSAIPAGNLEISNCIIINGTGNLIDRAIDLTFPAASSTDSYYIWNNIIANMTAYGISLGSSTSTNKIYCYNNTVRNSATAYRCYGLKYTFKNNIAQDCATENWSFSGTNVESTNNNTDNDAVPGANQITGEVTFIDESNANLLLSKTDTIAKTVGVNLSKDSYLPFDYDILGNRRGYIWDLGAHQITIATNYQMII